MALKLKRISAEELIRKLEKVGFVKVRQRGSHVVLKKTTQDETRVCIVPMHKELAIGTLRGILKQAKLSVEDFLNIE